MNIVYGAPSWAIYDATQAGATAADLPPATVVYGVMVGPSIPDGMGPTTVVYGVPGHPETWEGQQPTPQERDDWWEWAVKAGVVTLAAYGLYKLMTRKEQ